MPLQIKAKSVHFFPREGPPSFFFLDFLQPHPQIINGRPLRPSNTTNILP